MRRVTKNLVVFITGVAFTVFYCEFLIYYVVIAQCQWPSVDSSKETLKAFILSDTHLLGPRKAHWFDKWRREWQMHQAFQAIIKLHRPDVVFILGDLFDEGELSNEKQFLEYVERFMTMFSLPSGIEIHVVAGNHDIGFHNHIRKQSIERFTKLLKSPPVQFVSLKGNNFVLINSMAMKGDKCNLCTKARKDIINISDQLFISSNTSNYSRPVLLQHFPLYRESGSTCTEPDAPPLPQRNIPFRHKMDALSQEATAFIVSKIKPRAVFGGHTHYGCLIHQVFNECNCEFYEYSVPSFSWRIRVDPKYMLVTIAPDDYAVHECGLPRETTIVITAVMFIFTVIVFSFKRRSLRRRFALNRISNTRFISKLL